MSTGGHVMGPGPARQLPESETVSAASFVPGAETFLPAPPPLPPSELVGRGSLVADAVGMLVNRETRLLTLVGPGGVGKTRLALAVAETLATETSTAVAWVSLATILDARLVMRAIADALGVVESGFDQVVQTVARSLHQRSCFLVLDNFEHVLSGAPDIADLLAMCPGLSVLVTSRARLHLRAERVLEVRPLVLPPVAEGDDEPPLDSFEAVQFFAERARASTGEFELDAVTGPMVADMCRRLDGLPLAIELATARLRHVPLPLMSARLERRLPLLTHGPQDLPVRQQTLRNTMHWSHDLLTEFEQAVFRLLALNVDGCTLEAVASMYRAVATRDVPDDRIQAGLDALVDQSLVSVQLGGRGVARYTMLETVREYGLEQLELTGELEIAQRAHADWCLSLVRCHELADLLPQGELHLDVLDEEMPNFRAALEWHAANGHDEELLELAAALGRFWCTRTRFGEGKRWLEQALSTADTARGALRAKAEIRLGFIVITATDHLGAIQHFERALTLLDEGDDPLLVTQALIGLGSAVRQASNFADAESHYQRAEVTARQIADERLASIEVATALANQSVITFELGRSEEALAVAERAFEEFERVGFLRGMLLTSTFLALIGLEEGRPTMALEWSRTTLERNAQFGEPRMTTEAMDVAAMAASQAGSDAVAVRWFGAAAANRARIGIGHTYTARLQATHDRLLGASRMALGREVAMDTWRNGFEARLDLILDEIRTTTLREATPADTRFSARELEVLRMLVEGKTHRVIAESLFIGPRTVDSHVARIYRKLDVHTRGAAVAAALRAGIVDAPPEGPETVFDQGNAGRRIGRIA